jgi:hypothetical protein
MSIPLVNAGGSEDERLDEIPACTLANIRSGTETVRLHPVLAVLADEVVQGFVATTVGQRLRRGDRCLHYIRFVVLTWQ